MSIYKPQELVQNTETMNDDYKSSKSQTSSGGDERFKGDDTNLEFIDSTFELRYANEKHVDVQRIKIIPSDDDVVV